MNNKSHSWVLIVDDHEDARNIMVEALTSEGYTAKGVASGDAALLQLESTPKLPAVILLDLMMPKMDGWEFRKIQKNTPKIANIPVVIMSADHAPIHHDTALQVTHYLEKPFTLDQLFNVVKIYLG